jgi:hypothetical protein
MPGLCIMPRVAERRVEYRDLCIVLIPQFSFTGSRYTATNTFFLAFMISLGGLCEITLDPEDSDDTGVR